MCADMEINPGFFSPLLDLMKLHVTCYLNVVFAFWISEYMAIAVESAEMGGGVD